MTDSTQPMDYAERIARDRRVLVSLGIKATEDEGGEWHLSLDVTPERMNAGGLCHGGFLFGLADTALAYTLGAAGYIPATVDANITYLRPAREGDVIVAEVDPVRVGRTQGVVSVHLRRQSDQVLIATFRGTCVNLA